MRELDAVLIEQVLKPGIDDLAQLELLARLGHEFHPGDHGRILHRQNSLGLQGLEEHRTVIGVIKKLLTELLDDLAHLLHVGVIGHPEGKLHHRPVTGIVLHVLDLAERHRGEGPAVMAQLHRSDRDLLHNALRAADIDVFAFPEGIVDQVESAREDVADECLRAKADGKADNTGTGEERPDVHAQLRQHDHCGNHHDGDQQEVAKDRQEGRDAAFTGPADLGFLVLVCGTFLCQLPGNRQLDRPIGHVPKEDDQSDLDQAADNGVVIGQGRAPQACEQTQSSEENENCGAMIEKIAKWRPHGFAVRRLCPCLCGRTLPVRLLALTVFRPLDVLGDL